MPGNIDLETLIAEVKPLPMIVGEVIRVSENPENTIASLAQVVSKDPVLSAKIIHVVNSSLFSLLGRINDLNTAIIKLGVKRIRNLCISLNIAPMFAEEDEDEDEDESTFNRIDVWKHSIATGLMSELLADQLNLENIIAESFLAGLVHDIGIIVFEQHYPQRYKQLPNLVQNMDTTLCDLEINEFGFDHQKLGSTLLQKWKFPADISRAIKYHHHDEYIKEKKEILSDILSISDFLVSRKEVGFSDTIRLRKTTFSFLSNRVGLTVEAMKKVDLKFDQLIEEALDIFKLEGIKV